MIDKEKYPELHKAVEEVIETRLSWLVDAVEGRKLCELLPEEIKVLDISSVDATGGCLSLTINKGKEAIKVLKVLGVQGLKPRVSSFSKERFYSTGEGVLSNGTKFIVTVYDIGVPEGCKVEERATTRTENVLVCEGTGEEV